MHFNYLNSAINQLSLTHLKLKIPLKTNYNNLFKFIEKKEEKKIF